MYLYSLAISCSGDREFRSRSRVRSASVDRVYRRAFNEFCCPRSYSSPASTRIFDNDKDQCEFTEPCDYRQGHISVLDWSQVSNDSVEHFTQCDSEGVLHLFRDCSTLDLDCLSQIKAQALLGGRVVCVLAVPSFFSHRDFFQFLDSFQRSIVRLKVVRDSRPGRYMALLTLSDANVALNFYKEFNTRPFSTLVPETCHIAFIRSVNLSPQCELHDVFADLVPQESTAEVSVVEMPTCPVCLERMDFNETGIFTSSCRHSFHCDCISQWRDGRCPVCRFSLGGSDSEEKAPLAPQADSSSQCQSCGRQEDLWICLICGHVGCGRYAAGHAHGHYKASNHLFALNLGTQRVWDYAGDGYVHRLLEGGKDDSIASVPQPEALRAISVPTAGGARGSKDCFAKASKTGEEYAELVLSQLEGQRSLFGVQIAELQSLLESRQAELDACRCELLKMQAAKGDLTEARDKLEKELADCRKDQSLRERERDSTVLDLRDQIAQLKKQLAKAYRSVQDEKAFAESISINYDLVSSKLEQEQTVTGDLREQVRDLMFYIETNQKIKQSGMEEEIKAGKLVISSPVDKRQPLKKQKSRGKPVR